MFHGDPFGKHWLNRKISRRRQRRENLRTRQRSWLWTKNIDFPERSLKMRCIRDLRRTRQKKASGTGVARSLYSNKFLIELIRRRRFFSAIWQHFSEPPSFSFYAPNIFLTSIWWMIRFHIHPRAFLFSTKATPPFHDVIRSAKYFDKKWRTLFHVKNS